MSEFKNKIAIITGGSHGIGKATAIALAKDGCHIAFIGKTPERVIETTAAIIETGSTCLGQVCDIFDLEACNRFFKDVIDKYGTVHILINNVGGGGRWGKEDPAQTPESTWMEVYEKNVLSTMRFTFMALPYMRAQKWGRVISVTSRLAKEVGGRPWFNIAKAAQSMLMKNLSIYKDYVRDGITFNSVAPGDIMIPDTGWDQKRLTDPHFSEFLDHYPMGRMGEAEDVANAIAFLCSEKAAYINGISLAVDGGQSIT